MATTTTQQTETAPETQRGWLLPCPECGRDSCVTVHLHDLDGDEAFVCTECEVSFGRVQVERFITSWSACLLWLDSAPTYAAE